MNKGIDATESDRNQRGANRNGSAFLRGDKPAAASRGKQPKTTNGKNRHRP
jgi:hypothetical protein